MHYRYDNYENIDFDEWNNDLEINNEKKLSTGRIIIEDSVRWCLFMVVGMLTGVFTALIDIGIRFCFWFRDEYIFEIILRQYKYNLSEHQAIWYLLWSLHTIVPATCAVILTILTPASTGSGVPEVKSFLNGVYLPELFTGRLYITKFFAIILIAVSGMAAGKEGPMIHLGAIIGYIVLNTMKKHFHNFPLKENVELRNFVTAGCASGFASCFRTPIGGTLLVLEENITFWSINLMWLTFFSSVISVCSCDLTTSGILKILHEAGFNFRNESHLIYDFNYTNNDKFSFGGYEVPLFLISGIIGGVIGAVYVLLAAKLKLWKQKWMKNISARFIDSVMVIVLTVIISCAGGVFGQFCSESKSENRDFVVPAAMTNVVCEKNLTCNKMLSYWYFDQSYIINDLLNPEWDSQHTFFIIIYLIIFFCLNILTISISIPCGILVPSIILGAAWGRLYGYFIYSLFPGLGSSSQIFAVKYAVLGAAVQIVGISRIVMSAVLIVIFSTKVISLDINFALAIMLTSFVSKWVSDFIIEVIILSMGFYEAMIHISSLPFLPSQPPLLTSDITAKEIMSTDVTVFPVRTKASLVFAALQKYNYYGFPIVAETVINKLSREDDPHSIYTTYGVLKGFVTRKEVLALLSITPLCATKENIPQHFINEKFQKYKNNTKIIENDTQLVTEIVEIDYSIDFTPFMNKSPYIVLMNMSYPRIFRLLKFLGLHHVIVISDSNEVVGIITRGNLLGWRWLQQRNMP